MKAAKLKEWMEKTGNTPIDVASITKVHPNTVNNFLAGKSVHRSTEAAFDRLVKDSQTTGDGPPEAA